MVPSVLDLLILAAAAASSPGTDCRTITDPSARLACFDAREAAMPSPAQPASRSSSSAPAPAMMPAPAPSMTSTSPTTSTASSAAIIQADPSGRLEMVTPLRHGLFRMTLADGRMFDTATSDDAPPAVGTSVKLRRSALGTTFLDAPGRSPITVRLVRQDR